MGGIDLWFSNVGIGLVGKYEDIPIADHSQVIAANLVGCINDAHAVLPIFLAQDYGIFVNTVGRAASSPRSMPPPYVASKFGLHGFSEVLRGELSKHPRIHVCDV